jgi:molecular chaperone DnaK
MRDAEAHAAEDHSRREGIEKKNNLDSMIYQAEKTLSESSEKLDDSQKAALEGVLADAKKDLESEDAARIDAAFQRVQTELHKVAEVLYKAEAATSDPAGGAGESAGGGGAAADDDVIEADYTEETDQKAGGS